jgi:hypothetical protein
METKDKIAKRIFNLIGKYIETCNKDGGCITHVYNGKRMMYREIGV